MATIAATCEFEEQCLASRESSNGGIIRSSPIPPTNGGKVIAFWKFECSTRDILSQLLQCISILCNSFNCICFLTHFLFQQEVA